MRDAYDNYDHHKKTALKESKEIRDNFTWERAAKLASIEIDELYNNLPKNRIEISFDGSPKVQIYGSKNKKYFVEFIDSNFLKRLQTILYIFNTFANKYLKH